MGLAMAMIDPGSILVWVSIVGAMGKAKEKSLRYSGKRKDRGTIDIGFH